MQNNKEILLRLKTKLTKSLSALKDWFLDQLKDSSSYKFCLKIKQYCINVLNGNNAKMAEIEKFKKNFEFFTANDPSPIKNVSEFLTRELPGLNTNSYSLLNLILCSIEKFIENMNTEFFNEKSKFIDLAIIIIERYPDFYSRIGKFISNFDLDEKEVILIKDNVLNSSSDLSKDQKDNNITSLYTGAILYSLKNNNVQRAYDILISFSQSRFENLNEENSKLLHKALEELIKDYLKAKNYDMTIQLFSYIAIMDHKPNDIFFNKILDYINKQYCDIKITEYILNIMISNGIKASLVTFNTLLDLYIKKNDYKMAWHLFDALVISKNPAPDKFTYSIMINGIKNMKEPNFSKAIELFEVYKQTNTSDVIIYNSLIDLCIMCKQFDYVDSILKEMKEVDNIKCDQITYNTLIKSCTQLHHYEKAMQYFEEMKANQVKPNRVTYNSIMDLMVKKNDFQTAMKFLNLMKEDKINPDQYSYSIILNGIKSNRTSMETFNNTMSYIDNVMKNGLIHCDEIFYNSLIDVCLKYNQTDMALEYYKNMGDKSIKPSPVTFSVLIKVFGRKGDLKQAFKIFDHMTSLGYHVNEVTYGCLLDACIKNSRIDLAHEIWNNLKSTNMKLNTV